MSVTSGSFTRSLVISTNSIINVTSGKGIEIGTMLATTSNGNFIGTNTLTGNSLSSIAQTAIQLNSAESYSIAGTFSNTLSVTTNTVSIITNGHGLYLGTRNIRSTGDVSISNTLSTSTMSSLNSGTGLYIDSVSATSSTGRITETFSQTNVNYTTATRGVYIATRKFLASTTISTTYTITTSHYTTLTSDAINLEALDYTSAGALTQSISITSCSFSGITGGSGLKISKNKMISSGSSVTTRLTLTNLTFSSINS